MKKQNKNTTEFSKKLLFQESILIWIMSICFLVLAFYCIDKAYLGSLPWLTAMVGFPWGAYGISQACYYRKSQAENTEGGIKFQSMISNWENPASQYQNPINFNNSFYHNNMSPFYSNTSYPYSDNIDDFQI